MQMTWPEGRCPRYQAGKAIEALCDFRCRGGRLMISRLILPSRHASSLVARTSRYAPLISRVSGLSSKNDRSIKLMKSLPRMYSYSANDKGLMAGPPVQGREATGAGRTLAQRRQDLRIRRAWIEYV